MNIKRAKEEIRNTIEAYLLKDEYGAYHIPIIRQRPILLIGPPGVGKTQIMEQISQECRIGLVAYTITHHTRQSAIGLPYIQEKIFNGVRMSVTEYTMSEIVASIYEKTELTGLREGILFIDEINCVSETLAPAMLQFLQCKTFGNHRIPEGWIIVAAGNPPEYNKSVREFDVVTLDRLKMIHVEPDLKVWKEYASQVRIHPAILSYLDIKQQNFCQIETTVDGKRFSTPRGWEDLSRLIEVYEKLGKTVDRDVVQQYIQHEKIAKDFANYLELYYKYQQDYQIEEILEGTVKESMCDKLAKAPFDERLSVMSLLLETLNNHFRQLFRKEERLERLLQLFKGMKPGSYEEGEYSCALERLEGIAAGAQAEWKYKKEAGLLGRREDHLYQDTRRTLEEGIQRIKAEHLHTPEQVWGKIEEIFGEKNREYENLFENCGLWLENGFDFMEAAFGDSQEMVVFVTGLNTGFYSVKFLQEYSCERYYQYNKRLLFDHQEREILSRLS
ncbi:MAG: AAA domain-containing protein [Hungatella sp.]|nr:AAA domain-containing protein [Hungatella sp.]